MGGTREERGRREKEEENVEKQEGAEEGGES